MHAVVVRVNIQDFERGREGLERDVVPQATQAPGFVAGYWTSSEDRSNGLGMVVFESEENARMAASMIESQSPDEGVTLESVEVREVAASA
jgi:hypothetical protein